LLSVTVGADRLNFGVILMLMSPLSVGLVVLGLLTTTFPARSLVIGSSGQPLMAQAPKPTQAGNALLGLPRPAGAPAKPSLMFSANAYDQQGLNFQYKAKPDAAATFYQTQLAGKGYTERQVNTVKGPWGFNLVFDTAIPLAAKNAGKKVVLVVQGTAISADTMNINARFEEI
jgi:hypothetical protein